MKTHLLVTLFVVLIALAPLSYPAPLQTHNGFTPLYALMNVPSARSSIGALPLLMAMLLTRLAIAPDVAWKIVEALALLAGTLGMFALARRLYDEAAATIAATLYALLPYPLMTLYIRGDIGESVFLGLLPWVIYVGVRLAELRTRRRLVVASCLCGLLAAVLWRLCVPLAPDPSQAQAYLFQIFSARWDYGSRGDWLDAVPLQLGIVPVGLSVLALVLHPTRDAIVLGVIALACILLSIAPFSSWWNWSALLNEPWQLLGVAGLCACLLSASLVAREPQLQSLPALAAIVLLSVLAIYAHLEPRGYDYTPTKPPVARFSDEAYLVDAQAPPLRAGTTVTVTLLWQDLGTFSDDYTVFVHVVDAQQKIWTQRDKPPANGTRPTSSWQRGELLRDEYALTIPNDAPPNLRIEVGLYRSRDGLRMATTNGDDRVLIAP